MHWSAKWPTPNSCEASVYSPHERPTLLARQPLSSAVAGDLRHQRLSNDIVGQIDKPTTYAVHFAGGERGACGWTGTCKACSCEREGMISLSLFGSLTLWQARGAGRCNPSSMVQTYKQDCIVRPGVWWQANRLWFQSRFPSSCPHIQTNSLPVSRGSSVWVPPALPAMTAGWGWPVLARALRRPNDLHPSACSLRSWRLRSASGPYPRAAGGSARSGRARPAGRSGSGSGRALHGPQCRREGQPRSGGRCSQSWSRTYLDRVSGGRGECSGGSGVDRVDAGLAALGGGLIGPVPGLGGLAQPSAGRPRGSRVRPPV